MGEAALDLNGIVELAAEATRMVARPRERVRETLVAALRMLERRVGEALAGDLLRGLSDLAPGASSPLVAARALVDGRNGIDAHLPEDGREVLVWSRAGRLEMVRVQNRWASSRPATDAELSRQHAPDIAKIVGAAREALERHVVRCDRTARSYERAEALAARLLDL
jgi:hypothetical protein